MVIFNTVSTEQIDSIHCHTKLAKLMGFCNTNSPNRVCYNTVFNAVEKTQILHASVMSLKMVLKPRNNSCGLLHSDG